ncbi:MAG: 50S ribosomal protein L10 [Verrucomicrobiota bacterium]|nr:50S ribosomal protein L10 [Verrucomicrobiota bacterium]
MRPEKQYLVDEVGRWIEKSEYLFIARFTGLSVSDTAELRGALKPFNAEFHVVKNSILNVAATTRGIPSMDNLLVGQNAIVVGGKDIAGIAKALEKWFKDKAKGELKGGVFQKKILTPADVTVLSELPPKSVLQAKFLGLLNTPASSLVRVLNAAPQGLLNVLDAKSKQGTEAA